MGVTEQTEVLLDRLRGEDSEALGELVMLHRDRLWRMLYMRLDRRLLRRITPDDVLQETFLDVVRRIGEYLDKPVVPFYVWLRFLAIQRMQMMQRAHLGTQMRAVGQEVSEALVSSESMAGQLVSHMTSPSQAVIRRELQERLRAALDEMDPLDREVLALRHFEELGNNEVAEVLGISRAASSKRHVRALKRLRDILTP
jgi:RNA polymerase sigma-70 factor (ECF subfamily)